MAATLDDYDNLDDAASRTPDDIVSMAATELGETRISWRDI